MIYFTSDTHFGHNRKFIFEPRGFNSIEEMNEAILENWNNVVSDDDDIYVLGDFFLGTDKDFIKDILSKLKGKIHLIIGNHDSEQRLEIYRNSDNIVEITYATLIKYKKHYFYLSHYPTITSNLEASPKDAVYNLFGHVHTKDKFYEDRPYMYNVSVDANKNKPIEINDILDNIELEIERCKNFL